VRALIQFFFAISSNSCIFGEKFCASVTETGGGFDVLEWLVLCCPSLLSSYCRTVKQLEVADWFNQYSLPFLCFVFVTVSHFGDIFHVYENFDQVLFRFW
jgi:hypothetical protein